MVKRICGRCQTHNAAAAGQFDLLVRSVRLGEDEEYECQVLPGPQAAIKVPLRASVHIEIQGEAARWIRLGSKERTRTRHLYQEGTIRKQMDVLNVPPDEPTMRQDRTRGRSQPLDSFYSQHLTYEPRLAWVGENP